MKRLNGLTPWLKVGMLVLTFFVDSLALADSAVPTEKLQIELRAPQTKTETKSKYLCYSLAEMGSYQGESIGKKQSKAISTKHQGIGSQNFPQASLVMS